MKGAAVLTIGPNTRPFAVKARRFFGATNMDTAAQTCTVLFYASDVPGQGQVIACAQKLGTTANGATITPQMPADGVELSNGCFSFSFDTAPTGNGIAVYYEPLENCGR